MKKIFFFAAFAALGLAGANAQTVYNWNLRAGAGATSIMGTESDSGQVHPASYQLTLERRINRGLNAYFSVEGGAIGAEFASASTLAGKSFRTGFSNFTLGAILTPNNDRIMRYESKLVPYLGVGIGLSSFKTGVAGNGVASSVDGRGMAFNASGTAGLNFRLAENWSLYSALNVHMPMSADFTRTLSSSNLLVFSGVFGINYTFGRSRSENFEPAAFSYIETQAVLPPSKFEPLPFDATAQKVDTTKMLNDELTALKAKVAAMEGDVSSLRSKADGGADAAELKRLQDEVARLNSELEKAKNEIIDLGIRDAAARPVVNSHDFVGVNKQNYPNYFAYPPASLDGIFSQLKTVTIEMGSEATLRGENRNQLVNVVDLLARYPNLGVVVSANATGAGGASADLALSKKRAVSAEQLFLRNGATARQVISNYYGSEDPSAGNKLIVEFIRLK